MMFSDIPLGWIITTQNAGGDDEKDSDADPNTGKATGIVLVDADDS